MNGNLLLIISKYSHDKTSHATNKTFSTFPEIKHERTLLDFLFLSSLQQRLVRIKCYTLKEVQAPITQMLILIRPYVGLFTLQ